MVEEQLGAPQSSSKTLGGSNPHLYYLEHLEGDEQKSLQTEMLTAASGGFADQRRNKSENGGLWHTRGALGIDMSRGASVCYVIFIL